jgi:hypothetical protein
MRRLLTVSATAAALSLLFAPTAPAQEPVPPEPGAAPVVDVQQVLIPQTRGKLVRRGVTVQASCTPDCLLALKVSLPKGVARKMGLRSREIGSAIVAGTSGVPVFLRAPIKRKARLPLLDFEGSARLQVNVTALP